MRRRRPVTLVAYLALMAGSLLLGLIESERSAAFVLVAVLLGALAVGLYLGSRLAWFVLLGLQALNLARAIALPEWPQVAVAGVALGLLLAPPTRHYFRAEERGPETSDLRRSAQIAGIVVAGLLFAIVLRFAVFAPDPVAGDLALVRSDRPGMRVLLVGTTLVSDNAMPEMVRKLGEGAPGVQPIFTVRYARRGSHLHDALEAEAPRALLEDERWDRVVLQEHSQVMARGDDLEKSARAAAEFAHLARNAGAEPLLFSTPGYRDGDRGDVDTDTRAAMQARIRQAYVQLAARLSATVAPVGDAWEAALETQRGLDLWKSDGIRPNRTGSYLTACVLYAILTGENPRASSYTGGLYPPEARWLQAMAARAVNAARAT